MTINVCRLCDKIDKLQKSHIIPKFIIDWLKNTSATGKIRTSLHINKRCQDGLKLYWFCHNCEQMLGKIEKYFADEIFYPLNNGLKTVDYNTFFLKLAVSLSWRVLKYLIEHGQANHLNQDILNSANQALTIWHDFLFDKIKNPGNYEQHFYNFQGEIFSENKELPINIHRYLQRSIEIDVMSNGKIAFTYVKLPNFLFIGYINISSTRNWRETRIHVNNGIIEPKSYSFPQELWNIIQEKSKKSNELKKSISNKQKEKIESDYKKMTNKVVQSETIKSLAKDVNLFGKDLVFFENNAS